MLSDLFEVDAFSSFDEMIEFLNDSEDKQEKCNLLKDPIFT